MKFDAKIKQLLREAAQPRQCKAINHIKDMKAYSKPFQSLLKKFDNKLARAQKSYDKLSSGMTDGWWRSVGYSLEDLIDQMYTLEFIQSGDIEKFHNEQGWVYALKGDPSKYTENDMKYLGLKPTVSDLMC